jgi:5'-nucleotidase
VSDRPLVLVANDDGVAARGLAAMAEALSKHARVVVCAPETNQSASSHSLSLHRALRLRRVSEDVFAVDGTPADSVYVALHSGTRILPRRPDLVVSGMNEGMNLGVDVFYSGTVAAAREAALRGVPAIAVSAHADADRTAAATLGAEIAMRALAASARVPGRRASLLNVNIPPGDSWSVRATRLGARLYAEDVDYRRDPRGHEYLWIGGAGLPRHDLIPGSDTEAFEQRVASLTPLSMDMWAVAEAAYAEEVAG